MSADVYRYDQFSESQMATICRLRNIRVPYPTWLEYTLALLHDDRTQLVERVVTTAAREARLISNQRVAEWRSSTIDRVRILVGEENERRCLVDTAITNGSFRLSPGVEPEIVVGVGETERPVSAGF